MNGRMKSVFCTMMLMTPLLLAACSPTAKLTAPSGFAHVEGDYDDRITSARGVVIAARVEKNDPKANLDFWVEAIDLRLQKRGYVPLATVSPAKSSTGLSGKALRYKYAEKTYWVDVYVTGDRVVLVEAVGRAQDVTTYGREIESAMRDVKVN